MRIRIFHRTAFTYAGFARDSFNELRLGPLDDEHQRFVSCDIRVQPASPCFVYRDYHGNMVNYFDVTAQHASLVIEARSEIETRTDSLRLDPPPAPLSALNNDPSFVMLCEFLQPTPLVQSEDESVAIMAREIVGAECADMAAAARRIGERIHSSFIYAPGETGVDTTALDALRIRRGVCQDFAHAMIALCRAAGIPARYVSGYFFNDTRLDGEIEASHAWVESYVAGYGWVPFDPTHNRCADERYVKIATGRDYVDARPVNGTYSGPPTQSFSVEVSVERVVGADSVSEG